jgi:hypothetical protein
MNWVSMEIPQETIEVNARIRYNSPEVKAHLTPVDKDTVRVEFAQPQKSVTPANRWFFTTVMWFWEGLLSTRPFPERVSFGWRRRRIYENLSWPADIIDDAASFVLLKH